MPTVEYFLFLFITLNMFSNGPIANRHTLNLKLTAEATDNLSAFKFEQSLMTARVALRWP
jgi:hypothetical protein